MIETETKQAPQNADALEPLLSLDDVAEYFDVCKETVCRRIRDGRFPQPIRLGRRITRWEASTIKSWIADGCPIQE